MLDLLIVTLGVLSFPAFGLLMGEALSRDPRTHRLARSRRFARLG